MNYLNHDDRLLNLKTVVSFELFRNKAYDIDYIRCSANETSNGYNDIV